MHRSTVSAHQLVNNLIHFANTCAVKNIQSTQSFINRTVKNASSTVSSKNTTYQPMATQTVETMKKLADANANLSKQVGTCLSVMAGEGNKLLANTKQDNEVLSQAIQASTASLVKMLASMGPNVRDPNGTLYQQSLSEFNANTMNILNVLKHRVPAVLDSSETCWMAVQSVGNSVQGTLRELSEQLLTSEPEGV